MTTSKDFQKRMNMYLVKRNFRLAYKAFLSMNELRLQEGLEFFTMPNLQARFEK
jgi:hypothetical protein